MSRRPSYLLPLMLLSLAVRAPARDGPPPRQAAANLLRRAHGPVFSGSLACLVTDAFLEGQEPLKQILMPPQDLVVTWPAPMTFSRHRVEWQDRDIRATHYGLEYWDAATRQYRLIYEVRRNTDALRVHRFPPVTTKRIRFTVFEHPLRYESVVIRRMSLSHP